MAGYLNTEQKMGWLELEDGTRYPGAGFGATNGVAGTVVFHTGMMGHPESLTDPMYRGQMVVLAYPIVAGNGVQSDAADLYKLKKNFESDKIHASALILSNHHTGYSHWNSVRDLDGWLAENGVPGLYGIDTRSLVKHIRENGEMKGRIVFEGEKIEFLDTERQNLVKEVSCKAPRDFRPVQFNARTAKHVLAIDVGISNTLIRMLMNYNIRLRVVPWDYDIFSEQWDGLFISSGPDVNTSTCETTINSISKALALNPPKPVLGVGLGCILMARAVGAQIVRMKHGNRGLNQPCVDLRTTKCYMTSQNHGYTIDNSTLPDDWKMMFMNLNDRTNEGICHDFKPFSGVQFVPGSDCRPTDIDYIVKNFFDTISGNPIGVHTMPFNPVVLRRKALVVGSPGLATGETGQYDAMGCQAIKALRDANIEVVLINPNITSVQASHGEADKIYFLPVKPEFLKDVIKKEAPDCIMFTHGGQTAMNCGRILQKEGFLAENKIEVLGTPLAAADLVCNRDTFAKELRKIGLSTMPTETVTSMPQAMLAADKLGYPLVVRVTETMEGGRQYFAPDATNLRRVMEMALGSSGAVTVEKSLQGWKEVGYEVLRDRADNVISVADMENLYPMGMCDKHAIVVVPSHTLGSAELGMLQTSALKLIRHLGVIGLCHIRFALYPGSQDFYVTNVFTSLSSTAAFASRATGYPLGYVSTKISLGSLLTELENPVTTGTTACHEPTMDYCAIRIPSQSSPLAAEAEFQADTWQQGESAASGEVLAFGVRFSEALQKALRMANPLVEGLDGDMAMFLDPRKKYASKAEEDAEMNARLEELLSNPSGLRIFAVTHALRMGWTVDDVYDYSKIDRWFLERVKFVADLMNEVCSLSLDKVSSDLMRELKCCGFSDEQLAKMMNVDAEKVRAARLQYGLRPIARQVDTTAGEHRVQKEVLYLTYNGTTCDVEFPGDAYLVIGSGCNSVGYGSENDWNVVSCLGELKRQGQRTMVVSGNPQSVATDFTRSDRLYMEEISFERVLDICELENPAGVLASMGGNEASALSMPLSQRGVPILGTDPKSVERVEKLGPFTELLESLGINHPAWAELDSADAALAFANKIGYPCIAHRSFHGHNASQQRVDDPEKMAKYLSQVHVSKSSPLVITEMIVGATEIEMDAVARDGNIVVFGIIEHVEKTGIHAGDATLVLPAQKIQVETTRRIEKISHELAWALQINGVFKLHLFTKGVELYVSELHQGASRTLPFTSKVLNVNFVDVATQCALGGLVKRQKVNTFELEYVAVKAPVFSSTWQCGEDPGAGAQMLSTGAVASFGQEVYDAFLSALIGTGFTLPKKGSSILLSTGPLDEKMDFLQSVQALEAQGYKLYGTSGTAKFYVEQGCAVSVADNALKSVKTGEFSLVINIPTHDAHEKPQSYQIRRAAVDYSVPLVTNVGCAKLLVQALGRVTTIGTHSYAEYLERTDDEWAALQEI